MFTIDKKKFKGRVCLIVMYHVYCKSNELEKLQSWFQASSFFESDCRKTLRKLSVMRMLKGEKFTNETDMQRRSFLGAIFVNINQITKYRRSPIGRNMNVSFF